jgi:anti-repressor protein
MIDDAPWFVLADVCAVLEIENPCNVAARLDEDEKGGQILDTPGGSQQVTVISEPGLYAVLRSSRKPQAKRLDEDEKGVGIVDTLGGYTSACVGGD